MTKFSNEIFVATKVVPASGEPVNEIYIKIVVNDGDSITLKFDGGKATIEGNKINSSMVEVSNESSFTVDEVKGIVHIHLEITDNNNRELQLTEKVTYVKVE